MFNSYRDVRGKMRESFRYSETGKPRKRKIIIFDERVSPDSWTQILSECRGHILERLPLVNGVVALVDDDEVRDVQALVGTRSGVIRVDDDIDIEMAYEVGPLAWGPKFAESVPWGVSRVRPNSLEYTGRGVKVAVLDTGIDTGHPDLGANVRGTYNAMGHAASARDDNGHGTHVAGTIGALRNGIGVQGVAPRASLYAVKVLDAQGSGKLSSLVGGLSWCVEKGIRVLNMSLSSGRDNQTFREAIQNARRAGLTMVCAAGNSGPGADTVGYPAKYVETIAVAATAEDDNIADFSSRGREVDLCAPGVDILSAWPGRKYRKSSGTSMAAPHVTGAVALLLEADSSLSPSDIKSALQATADRLDGPSYEEQGSGIINIGKALERVSKKRMSVV
ncbi:MAG: S8 family peptidase [Firmicutes bacterium]|jgi:subtilisin|nr:S8 family peptidase [Bacillota bacterium]